jgi:hypothetical protein
MSRTSCGGSLPDNINFRETNQPSPWLSTRNNPITERQNHLIRFEDETITNKYNLINPTNNNTQNKKEEESNNGHATHLKTS